jgi:hypothetical protein
MKHKHLNSRTDKIKFLQRLTTGQATIRELMPVKVESWYQDNRMPDKFINEETGECINAAQMREKERTKGDNIIFLTVCCYEYETTEPKR